MVVGVFHCPTPISITTAKCPNTMVVRASIRSSTDAIPNMQSSKNQLAHTSHDNNCLPTCTPRRSKTKQQPPAGIQPRVNPVDSMQEGTAKDSGSAISLISLPHSPLISNTPQFHSSFPIPTETYFSTRTNAAAAAAVYSHSSNLTLLSQPCPPPPLYNSTPSQQQQQQQQRGGPYHDWNLFSKDFAEMLRSLKIFVYPDVSNHSAPFSQIFLPHPSPFHPKLGNYFSEHMFKINLLHSPFLASTHDHPTQAQPHFFFLPFSINAMRNHPRLHSEASISDFVAHYTTRISREFGFWNATGGADHFYVSCHSVGRDAASKHRQLLNNAVQVTCSSSYFQRFYVAHKDVGLPQIWPRPPEKILNPPHARDRLAFFAGRAKNSQIRQELIAMWANDTIMDVFSGSPPYPYEQGFRKSRYCLHVKGYEVNTARISDALHYGCIPVIISNHFDLPFANVLDWSQFSIVVSHADIPFLKRILLSVPTRIYINMFQNLYTVRKHFQWHMSPRGYDAFHMTAYQLWQVDHLPTSKVSIAHNGWMEYILSVVTQNETRANDASKKMMVKKIITTLTLISKVAISSSDLSLYMPSDLNNLQAAGCRL
ncbi:hypothetical protein ACLOJK_015308 [Asimina triloba]